jgi:glutamate dehydrogenase
MAWMHKQQRVLRRFRRSLGAQGVGGNENSRYLELLKSADQAGLSAMDAAHLAAMPELTQMATAVHISTSEELPLAQCLKATQAAMHLLPIPSLESALRSSMWSGDEAHALRREWLHRLTLLKERATKQLIQYQSRSLLEAGTQLWGQHKHWPQLQESIRLSRSHEPHNLSDEAGRLRLILTLTHLESVIDES